MGFLGGVSQPFSTGSPWQPAAWKPGSSGHSRCFKTSKAGPNQSTRTAKQTQKPCSLDNLQATSHSHLQVALNGAHRNKAQQRKTCKWTSCKQNLQLGKMEMATMKETKRRRAFEHFRHYPTTERKYLGQTKELLPTPSPRGAFGI